MSDNDKDNYDFNLEYNEKEDIIKIDENIKSVPIYDLKEPYYIYKRKLDKFYFDAEKKKLYDELLAVMNNLCNTKYTELSKFTKIKYIPQIPENIMKKYNLNENISNAQNFNILLNKIKY